MKTHNLVQGSQEWHEFRSNHFGSSEAAAMLGLSKQLSRNDLLLYKKTGKSKEYSDWVQANILDYGHEVEAMARELLESELGDELYPVVFCPIAANKNHFLRSGYKQNLLTLRHVSIRQRVICNDEMSKISIELFMLECNMTINRQSVA